MRDLASAFGEAHDGAGGIVKMAVRADPYGWVNGAAGRANGVGRLGVGEAGGGPAPV